MLNLFLLRVRLRRASSRILCLVCEGFSSISPVYPDTPDSMPPYHYWRERSAQAGLRGPAAGHPERVLPERPPSAVELPLWEEVEPTRRSQ
jgi:uncharacterized protein DUF6059